MVSLQNATFYAKTKAVVVSRARMHIIVPMISFLATSDIIGIISTIALVAITLAVCVYLYGLKGKEEAEEKESDNE